MAGSEERLGALAVTGLSEEGWDIYQEVQLAQGRADIVGVMGPCVGVWELKQSPSLTLVEQLMRWRGSAHHIGAVTWKTKSSSFVTICRHFGFSWTQLDEKGRVVSQYSGHFERAPAAKLVRAAVRPEHKTHAKAGSAAGGFFSPWRLTVTELETVARDNPGIPLADAMRKIRHHYRGAAAARAGAVFLFSKGLVPGTEIVKEAGRLVLRPTTGVK